MKNKQIVICSKKVENKKGRGIEIMTLKPYEISTEERRILEALQDQMRAVLATIHELVTSISDTMEGKPIDEKLEKISEHIERSDEIKRTLMAELSLAAPGLLLKEDILKLITRLDRMVDSASGTFVYLTGFKSWQPDEKTRKELINLAEILLNLTHKLREAIYTITINSQDTLKAAKEVSLLEKEIDDRYRSLIIELLESKDLEVGKLLLIIEVIKRIDNIADYALDAADAIDVIAITRLG